MQVLSGEIGPEVGAVPEDRAQLHEPVLLEQVLPGHHIVAREEDAAGRRRCRGIGG